MRKILLVVFLALPLSSCLSVNLTGSTVAHRDEDRPATVSPAAAAALVNAFRASNGLPPVVLDPKLATVAQRHADKMAARDNIAHVLPGEGSIGTRFIDAGYKVTMAVENIGAGYHDLDEAFSGWRASPHHRDNMLKKGVTRMGIAVAYSAESKYKDFWSLVLAADEGKVAQAPVGFQ